MSEPKQRKIVNFFTQQNQNNNNSLAVASTSSSSKDTTGQSTSTPQLKRKTLRKCTNIKSWMQRFEWLDFDEEDEVMKCKICINSKNPHNAFVKGSKNFQRSALTRHEDSDDHKLGKKILTQRRFMNAAQEIVHQRYEPILIAQFKTAVFMARENIADKKFAALIDLQLSNGASVFSQKKGIYTHNQACAEMQKCLAAVCRQELRNLIQGTPYLGIMCDESLDIAVTKKLVIYCKIINSGDVKMLFCSNIEVLDGKANTIYNALTQFLHDMGVNAMKVSGLGTDGASVMTGRLNGVGVKLKNDNPLIVHVWCAAHRLSLVAHWAADKIDFLKSVQETMVAIYFFYSYSAQRYNKIKELTRIMGAHVKRFKKPTQVRWLSVYEAVDAIYGAYSVLFLSLDHEATGNNDGSAKAKGIKIKIQTYKFVATLCLLKDILQSVTRLSKIFQLDVIDIDQMQVMLQTTREHIQSFQNVDPPSVAELNAILDSPNNPRKEFMGVPVTKFNNREKQAFQNVKRQFVANLETEFEKRFPPEDMKVLKNVNNVLNPRLFPRDVVGLRNHGTESLNDLIAFYGNSIDHDDLRNSFQEFKLMAANNRDLSFQDFCLKLCQDYDIVFPGFCKLAQIILTVPMTSVPCERGFSVQNKVITPLRNKLGVQNVENKILIQSSMLGIEELCGRACRMWLESGRSKFPQ